jgi:hypothetical protein
LVLPNGKNLVRNALEHFSQVDTTPLCWCRTTALPSPIMRMEKGRDVPHPG